MPEDVVLPDQPVKVSTTSQTPEAELKSHLYCIMNNGTTWGRTQTNEHQHSHDTSTTSWHMNKVQNSCVQLHWKQLNQRRNEAYCIYQIIPRKTKLRALAAHGLSHLNVSRYHNVIFPITPLKIGGIVSSIPAGPSQLRSMG